MSEAIVYRFTLAVHRDAPGRMSSEKVYVGHCSVDTSLRGADAMRADKPVDLVNMAMRACRADLGMVDGKAVAS